MSKCPKCDAKISPLYMKEKCPNCGVNLLYYDLENRLEKDAEQADREYAAVEHFLDTIKSSSISSPIMIVRFVLFFTPLASMCLPMYGDVSLISLIMGIIKGSVELSSVIMPLVSMVLVIVLSLAVISSSLFSVTKTGFLRNMIFSAINTIVFVVLGVVIGGISVGWHVTLAIYVLEIIMHIICNNKLKSKKTEA